MVSSLPAARDSVIVWWMLQFMFSLVQCCFSLGSCVQPRDSDVLSGVCLCHVQSEIPASNRPCSNVHQTWLKNCQRGTGLCNRSDLWRAAEPGLRQAAARVLEGSARACADGESGASSCPQLSPFHPTSPQRPSAELVGLCFHLACL